MQIKYSGNLESDMRLMLSETAKLYKNFTHIPRAFTVPLGGLYRDGEFARLLTLLAIHKIKGYKR